MVAGGVSRNIGLGMTFVLLAFILQRDVKSWSNQLAVLDRASRGYLGFPLSKKRLGRGKQTFYFKGHAMKTAVLSASSVAACSVKQPSDCWTAHSHMP